VNVLVGSLFILAGVVAFVASPSLAGLWRKRDEHKADPRRNLDWSENFDTSIFRFLAVSLVVVGVLILTHVIPL
jgi:hypothetical protein